MKLLIQIFQRYHGPAQGEDRGDQGERRRLLHALLAHQHLRDDGQGEDDDPDGNLDDHLVRNVLVALRIWILYHSGCCFLLQNSGKQY